VQSDQYSLGYALYELLTGQTPFGGPPEIQLFLHQTQPPPLPGRINPAVPPDLEAICLKTLEKEPARRYPNCQELADDLRRWLDDEPVRARTPGLVERTIKWARRKPFQAATAIASALFLAVFVFAVVREARDYRRKYEQQVRSENARKEFEKNYLAARELTLTGQWVKARDQLAEIQGGLASQADPLADDLQARVKQTLDEVVQHLQDEEMGRLAQTRLKVFRPPHGQAMFHWAPLAGDLLPDRREQARAAARQALAIYGLDTDPDQPQQQTDGVARDRPHLKEEEFARLTDSCYELLFIWAEVEAGPDLPGNAPRQQIEERGRRALALLERARLLGQACGLDTQAWYACAARYRAQSRGEPVDPAQLQAAAPRQPTGALDWFLKGLELYQAGSYEPAGNAARQALQLQGDHFWARYLEGLCHLRAGGWQDARGALTLCVEQRPEFPWSLIFRGFAASELGARYAQQELQALLAQGPEAESTRIHRRNKETEFALARADLDKALRQQLEDPTRYVALANRGVLSIRQERWAEASADLKQAVTLIPEAFQAYANLAQALEGAGQGPEAITASSQAIKRIPGGARLHRIPGQSVRGPGQTASAAQGLESGPGRFRASDRSRAKGQHVKAAGG
jgi:tetratricopeptide (TPR) repeat protein